MSNRTMEKYEKASGEIDVSKAFGEAKLWRYIHWLEDTNEHLFNRLLWKSSDMRPTEIGWIFVRKNNPSFNFSNDRGMFPYNVWYIADVDDWDKLVKKENILFWKPLKDLEVL